MIWTTLAPTVGFEKSFWHKQVQCKSFQRHASPAAESQSDAGAEAGSGQVQAVVYAQHGRELMGLKSPVRAPPCSRREDTGSPSRRQLREGDRPWKGSRRARLRAYEQKQHKVNGPGKVAQHTEALGAGPGVNAEVVQ